MAAPLDFTGRVALVTGAGRGIGLAYAELLAARGAKVVVNDLGTGTSGGGVDESLATVGADGIVAAGGVAVADTSDISTPQGGTQVVRTAVEAFGQLDIVINNAGIFALDAFPDLEIDLLQKMFAVHVAGTFNVTQAAWPHLVASNAGRVVITSSTSALGGGNTVAYTTAKAGLFGMGRALAVTAEADGIKVNMVAPQAMTRMMSTGMGRGGELVDFPDRGTELVAPLVAVLSHESCPVTGETFVSGMRRVSRLAMAEADGYIHPGIDLTPEDVVEHWGDILNEDQLRPIASVMDFSIRQEGLRGTYEPTA